MRRIGFIVLAGLAATIAALMVQSALRTKDTELQKAKVTATEIVVAARDLPVGTKLQISDVRVARWPRDSVPAGAVADSGGVLGSIVKVEMVENEPITGARLYTGDTAGILSLVIPPDMRAMSVAVDEVSDISGFVLPHAHVDVLVAIKESGAMNAAAARSKIVLENVEVLAVAQTTDHKDKPQVERVVTLLVTPEEAERLALATHEGSLRLALRNFNDQKIVNTTGSSVSTLLASYGGVPERPQVVAQAPMPFYRRPAPPPRPAIRIEVMRDGSSRDALSFGADGRPIRPVEAQAPAGPPPPPPDQAMAVPPAPARITPVGAVANGAPNRPQPAGSNIPAAEPAGASGDSMVAFQGPDAKTIQVH